VWNIYNFEKILKIASDISYKYIKLSFKKLQKFIEYLSIKTCFYHFILFLLKQSWLMQSRENVILRISHGKNNFSEISKNLARYKSENNFVGSSK